MDENRVNRLLARRWVAVTGLVTILLCCGLLAYVLVPRFRLVIHQVVWRLTRPSDYCMTVREVRPDGGDWRWLVYVQDSHPASVHLLEVGEYPDRQSWLDPDSLTMEQLFAGAHRFCADRGFLFCGLEFDPKSHHLSQILSYELILIEVERFASDAGSSEDCVSPVGP